MLINCISLNCLHLEPITKASKTVDGMGTQYTTLAAIRLTHIDMVQLSVKQTM
jgi:hypothetical protein